MSLLSWLFAARADRKPVAESSGLSRVEATRPVARRNGKEVSVDNAQPANRKTERMARRELLYLVVREAMMRAGVLTASYKFKVLSLDGRGRQFLVMVDLSRDYQSETARLAEIEALIAQAAKSRHDIVVTSVYWRMNEHVAVGDPNAQLRQTGSHSQPAPLDSMPAVLETPPPVADPAHHAAAPQAPGRAASHYDPIQPDEVAAFKNALAAGVPKPAAVAAAAVGLEPVQGANARAFDGSAHHGPQSYTLLTGFEDTELPDPELHAPNLSGTQYGQPS
jgi:hypothetical protein